MGGLPSPVGWRRDAGCRLCGDLLFADPEAPSFGSRCQAPSLAQEEALKRKDFAMESQSPRHRAKKRFGQNFLQDRSVIERIMAAADLGPSSRALEIGPGLGALTHPLLAVAGHLDVFEVDRDLVEKWRESESPKLTVHEGDALRIDWATILVEPPYVLVSNLPYNISSQIVFKVLEHRHLFSRLVLMFQKEVGDRLIAAPGGRDYGILSVLCQVWYDIRRVALVRPGAFVPRPKVDSVVLSFRALATPRVQVADWRQFVHVVKAAFAQRRKALRGALTSGGWSKPEVLSALESAGIDSGRRAETLSLEEFARLAFALYEKA